jgi:hypothetical protein
MHYVALTLRTLQTNTLLLNLSIFQYVLEEMPLYASSKNFRGI